MKAKLIELIYRKYFLYSFAVALALGVSFQLYFAPKKDFGTGKEIYTKYNNYLIFKNSFEHLKNGESLYKLYPNEQWDLYKYTPTFSLFMAPFYALPDLIGLILWNLLNVIVLVWALTKMPLKNKKMYLWIFGFTLIELITSTQNTQSNALILGLVVAGFNFLENKKQNYAILLISLAVMIKPFALFAFIPFLFHSRFFQNLGKMLFVNLFLILLPLILMSPEDLAFQYSNWIDLLMADHGTKYGFSVMGWMQTWFGLEMSKLLLLFLGIVSLLIPLTRVKYFQSNYFKINYLALILIWMVIFNHMAESPTFVIAVFGVGLWFFYSERNWLDILLVSFVVVFTILISTDIFPKGLRKELLESYVIKGVPCILVYIKIIYDMMSYHSKKAFLAE